MKVFVLNTLSLDLDCELDFILFTLGHRLVSVRSSVMQYLGVRLSYQTNIDFNFDFTTSEFHDLGQVI